MSISKRQKIDTENSSVVKTVAKYDRLAALSRRDKNGGLMKLKLRNKGLPEQDRSWLWITAAT